MIKIKLFENKACVRVLLWKVVMPLLLSASKYFFRSCTVAKTNSTTDLKEVVQVNDRNYAVSGFYKVTLTI